MNQFLLGSTMHQCRSHLSLFHWPHQPVDLEITALKRALLPLSPQQTVMLELIPWLWSPFLNSSGLPLVNHRGARSNP